MCRGGENIVSAGSEAKRGERLLSPGARISYAELAVAAAVGRSRLLVYAKPRVAVLSTGDEVVDVDVPPGPNQIRNSNTYSLAAQIQAAGGEAVLLPIAPDEPVRLRELLKEGLESDLLLIAGGVSMGKYDLVEQALTEMRAELFSPAQKFNRESRSFLDESHVAGTPSPAKELHWKMVRIPPLASPATRPPLW